MSASLPLVGLISMMTLDEKSSEVEMIEPPEATMFPES
jgi:hypothetical protein